MKSLLGMVALFVAGCGFEGVTGSGNLITKDVPATDFQKIEAGGSFVVDVTQGEKPSVVITADDNIWPLLNVETRDGTLHLEVKSGSYNNVHLEAKVVTPRLDGVTLSGATKGTLHGIDRQDGSFGVSVSGASSLEGDVRTAEMKLELSGASKATLTGSADTIHIDASGASHAALDGLAGKVAHAKASGASEVDLKATGKLDYNVSGASHLAYAGSPVIEKAETSGASEARAVK